MKKRILTLLLAVGLVFSLAVSAFADDVPDLTQKGSINFKMDVDGVALDSGKLNMYYVATLKNMGGIQYDFSLLDELKAAGATLDSDKLYDDVQAENLLLISKSALSDYLSAPIEDGFALFENLNAGLYLVWQDTKDASRGYAAIKPFLISVPALRDGVYVMDVEADPKVPFETTPSPPPTPPPPPYLPQTGQLNWPIPLMVISGMVLIVLGWILCIKRERIGNEK